jgi:catalase
MNTITTLTASPPPEHLGSANVADLSDRLVDALNTMYGTHSGHRAAHAKGVLCAATFTATPAATELSRAPHLQGDPLRAHVRFSNGSGNPAAPDGDRDGRGVAIKIYLPAGGTTDMVGLTLPVFFVRTPDELLAFNEARLPDPATGQLDMDKVGAFLAAHPETVPAVTAAITAPRPESYARLTYHGIHAFRFVAADGSPRHARWHLVPADGETSIGDGDDVAPDYLRQELADRLANGPAVFHLELELAEPDDPVDDPTAVWPEGHARVRIARLDITGLAFDRERDGDVLVFDPTRVPDGVELTADPILHARSGAYRVSVERRTAAQE